MSINNVVAATQPQQVNQQPGQVGAPPAVPPPPPPAGPPAAKVPGAPAIPNLKAGGPTGTSPASIGPGTPVTANLKVAGQLGTPPAANAPDVPAIPNLKAGGPTGTSPAAVGPGAPAIPNLKAAGQPAAPPAIDASGAPLISSLQSAGQPSARPARDASGVPVVVATDQGINAPTPEELAAKASLLGGQSIEPQQSSINATSPCPKNQLLNVTPEEEAAGMSIESGLKALSKEGGQSLQGQISRALPDALTPENALNSPDFKKLATQAWTDVQNQVDNDPKHFHSLGKALEKAKLEGKGPGDLLDNTPQSGITRYLDADGKPAGASVVANGAQDNDGVDQVTGKLTTAAQQDPSAQPRTGSIKWNVDGALKPLDPSRVPYVSFPPEFVKFSGARQGDLVRIRDGDHVAYGVFADVGPGLKYGEMSQKALELMGNSTGGTGDAVRNQHIEYTVMSGTGATYLLNSKQNAKSSDEIQRLGATAYEAFSSRLR